MVKLGSKLREDMIQFNEQDVKYQEHIDENGSIHQLEQKLFTPQNPLLPSKIKVVSTDFPRAIQSVQGLLVGK